MVKSTASCFKIIGCGGDSVEHDDLQTNESKGSSDRRRWSFRKRSARHRVLSNSVSTEAPASANKENPESPAVNLQVQPDLVVPEKTSVIQLTEEKTVPEKTSVIPLTEEKTVPEKTSVIQLTEEKTELPDQEDSKLSDTLAVIEDDCKADVFLDEPSIIIIQAAIRSLLAQQVLLKQKNIIKLQAAVRGHIVRRHAVGTLRCVQAIIKMQALVRERLACRLEGEGDSAKRKKAAEANGTYTYVSIEKLLTNAFARQLMESTPRTTPINIKCDPLKSDSAWKWLERWMSVSSVSSDGPKESGLTEEPHKENLGHPDGKEDILVPSECYSESTYFTSGVGASAEASENRDILFSDDANNFDLHSAKSISPSPSLSNLHNIDQSNSASDVKESGSFEMKETDFIEVVEVKSLPKEEETEKERDVPDLNKNSIEQPETEVKKLSRQASNPAFIAAQSKFEELTKPLKLTSSSSHDFGVEAGLDKVSSVTSAVQIGSECGTELSISSTLDSPDRSEAGVNEIEQETKVSDKSDENLEKLEANKTSTTLETDPSYTNTNDLNVETLNFTNAVNPKHQEKKPEADLESEASPRSHITVPESQATPSSQVSVKPKKSKGEKSDSSNRKNRSSSGEKIPKNQDSGSRNSLEQLQENNKTGKRRNSFGSAKPDKEQEARDSSSSNSLPSYMQATESARAKAIANGSPRSSPDVNEKDIYIKKRHSLPGTNERQGSPRIQRSLSQAQPNAKGNATHSPQDRKWRR